MSRPNRSHPCFHLGLVACLALACGGLVWAAAQTSAADKATSAVRPTSATPAPRADDGPLSESQLAEPQGLLFGLAPRGRVKMGQLSRRKHGPSHIFVFWPYVEGESDSASFQLAGDTNHVLTLSLVVQVDDPDDIDRVKSLEQRAKEFVTGYLTNKNVDDMGELSERMRLKEAVILFLNNNLASGSVREVYIGSTYKLHVLS